MSVTGTRSGETSIEAPRGPVVTPTSLRTEAAVVIADATDTAWSAAESLNSANWSSIENKAECAVMRVVSGARVRFAARASTSRTGISTSPAIAVFAVDADSFDDTDGFTNIRSIERLDDDDPDAAGTELTFESSPSGKHPIANGMYIGPYTDSFDLKGRRFVVAILRTAAAGAGSGTIDIIGESPN